MKDKNKILKELGFAYVTDYGNTPIFPLGEIYMKDHEYQFEDREFLGRLWDKFNSSKNHIENVMQKIDVLLKESK